ncbi:SsgA family sporulation/cell division regulator [Streptomyces sp. NPDC051771]|uniref:SsgA family sporulation/cell division regulator n=1 Tax=Streptomyces sp. NPDC051771 TaxID=3154847 RepID=UPI0034121FD8
MTGGNPEQAPRRAPQAADCVVPLTLAAYTAPDRTMPVPARLRYHRGDPYAVHLDCRVGLPAPVTWVFARDLLVQGLNGWAGPGDVSVHPSLDPAHDVVYFWLHPPGCPVTFHAPRTVIEDFLAATYAIVPAGRETEYGDLEAQLGRLLARGAPPAG